MMRKPREIALSVLLQREQGIDYVENLLSKELPALSPQDRGLCQELVFGVARNQVLLDWLIGRKTGNRPQKAGVQTLLRLGLYQLFWLKGIPDHATVNETVEVARRAGHGPQSGFLNAVLRNYARERDETRKTIERLKSEEPHVAHSHPQWLLERWSRRWGREKAIALMEWNNTPPKTYARVNQLQVNPGKLLEQWREEDVDYDFCRFDWIGENQVFQLRSHPPLNTLKSFLEGGFYIQDPSTLLAVRMLNPRSGETILDRCAAPGGKTALIAEVMQDEGRIVAQDRAEDRLDLIQRNCERLGISCVEISRSGSVLFPELSIQFDRILVDAPCSNTGVMRRRVDLRWRLRPAELDRLQKEQLNLLQDTAPLLRSGGVLVYSTCSLEPEENQLVVEEFLVENPEFERSSERLLTPFEDQVDGAYVAVLTKTD